MAGPLLKVSWVARAYGDGGTGSGIFLERADKGLVFTSHVC